MDESTGTCGLVFGTLETLAFCIAVCRVVGGFWALLTYGHGTVFMCSAEDAGVNG